MDWLNRFDAVWSIDFEFSCPPGERPSVVCMVAREYFSKRLIRISMDDLRIMERPPFDIGDRSLFVAYFSSAEWNCFLSLGWPLPIRVLDLWCEYKNLLNGSSPQLGWGLLSCLAHFGFDTMSAAEKDSMRQLAMRGGSYSQTEMDALLDYCQVDVDALDKLLSTMLPKIDFPRAIHRGRYMLAVARMEHSGIPIDTKTLSLFRRHWDSIKSDLIRSVDVQYGVFDGMTFKQDRFAAYLIRNGISWPTTASGRLAIDEETFRCQSKIYPQVSALRELRHSLSELKLEALEVGTDGRNRTMLRPFASRSGRNQPSNNKFIFGPSVWIRGLIQPRPGYSVAYIDWSMQEIAIAAALSKDPALIQAYVSGDPYLEFARMAGAVPSWATKQSHPRERSAFKQCMLATSYGQKEHGLAEKLGTSVAHARNLLRQHCETFPTFWKWSQSMVDSAMLGGSVATVFGWTLHTLGEDNPRSLGNFPMQANGAEMMRLACCLATENGITVCCPVHDALLIEAPTESIDEAVTATQSFMAQAARIVLDGFEVRSDAKIVHSPARYMDEDRGQEMWNQVFKLATELDTANK